MIGLPVKETLQDHYRPEKRARQYGERVHYMGNADRMGSKRSGGVFDVI
jgi:hypothetical protein